jgi:hypothetical protein
MMLITGPAMRRRSRHGVYRWPLRVQTINAEIRPTNVSRIISIRIIKDSPFRFQRRPGPLPGLSCLKLRCFAQEPASSLSMESYLMSGAALAILAGKSGGLQYARIRTQQGLE